jgi:5-formyltetrahydrofolate cyclo-ligase
MLFETKDEIRNIFREKRTKISDRARKLKNRDITKNFYANISIKPKSVIAGYIPFGSEVDISLLLEMYEDDGHTLCLPCVDEKDSPMVFRKYKKGVELVTNKNLKIQEPPEHFEEVIPNLIITPLVAFDSSGSRLGMGAGYYDRTFDYLNGFNDFIAVGVAFAVQQTEYIKRETHDFKMDAVVTEEKVLVF